MKKHPFIALRIAGDDDREAYLRADCIEWVVDVNEEPFNTAFDASVARIRSISGTDLVVFGTAREIFGMMADALHQAEMLQALSGNGGG